MTLYKKYKSNTSKAEKPILNKWSDNIINSDNGFILRIQDKDKRFKLVDQKTVKEKQINRSERVTLKELILVQIHYIFTKRSNFQKNR